MTASYFRSLAARCRTASHDCFDLAAALGFPSNGRKKLKQGNLTPDDAATYQT